MLQSPYMRALRLQPLSHCIIKNLKYLLKRNHYTRTVKWLLAETEVSLFMWQFTVMTGITRHLREESSNTTTAQSNLLQQRTSSITNCPSVCLHRKSCLWPWPLNPRLSKCHRVICRQVIKFPLRVLIWPCCDLYHLTSKHLTFVSHNCIWVVNLAKFS